MIEPHPIGCVFKSCDFCGKEGEIQMRPLAGDLHYGWLLCYDSVCKHALSLAEDAHLIPLKTLESEFGTNVKVMRSPKKTQPGLLQPGWKIVSDSFKMWGQFMVRLKIHEITDGKLIEVTKTVFLDDLRKWQVSNEHD